MNLTNRAELVFRTSHSDVIERALSPELSEKIPRTKLSVTRGDGEVRIQIEAEDHTSLRAALNSYIRWANVAEETAKEVEKR